MESERNTITPDGKDLAFISLTVTDRNGNMVPNAVLPIQFIIEGPGEIVATDNGNATDMNAFPSTSRETFSGKCLVIVRAKKGSKGFIKIKARTPGIDESSYLLTIQ